MFIMMTLGPLELDVVNKLNEELDKVEKFYIAREQEARKRYVVSSAFGMNFGFNADNFF